MAVGLPASPSARVPDFAFSFPDVMSFPCTLLDLSRARAHLNLTESRLEPLPQRLERKPTKRGLAVAMPEPHGRRIVVADRECDPMVVRKLDLEGETVVVVVVMNNGADTDWIDERSRFRDHDRALQVHPRSLALSHGRKRLGERVKGDWLAYLRAPRSGTKAGASAHLASRHFTVRAISQSASRFSIATCGS